MQKLNRQHSSIILPAMVTGGYWSEQCDFNRPKNEGVSGVTMK